MDTPELVHTQAVVALKLHWRLVLACWPVMLWDTIIIIGMVTAKLTCSGCSVYLELGREGVIPAFQLMEPIRAMS